MSRAPLSVLLALSESFSSTLAAMVASIVCRELQPIKSDNLNADCVPEVDSQTKPVWRVVANVSREQLHLGLEVLNVKTVLSGVTVAMKNKECVCSAMLAGLVTKLDNRHVLLALKEDILISLDGLFVLTARSVSILPPTRRCCAQNVLGAVSRVQMPRLLATFVSLENTNQAPAQPIAKTV